MPRIPLIAGNWKMNTDFGQAESLIKNLLSGLNAVRGVEKLICPPFTWLVPASRLLKGSSVALGAQNMYHQDWGAFTGEISPNMLKSLCKYVIIGHSERRNIFGETDDMVNKKLLKALQTGLTPILCVGENIDQRNSGGATNFIISQIEKATRNMNHQPDFVVAYEPIWAIGTGKASGPDDANQMMGVIRSTLADILSAGLATKTRIIYGGSVTASNISDFISQPEIDGALVGGASLDPDQFTSITRKAASNPLS